jgi:hypothetical protein
MGASFAQIGNPAFPDRIETFRIRPALSPLAAPRNTAREKNRFSFILLLVALAFGAAIELFGPTWAQAILQIVQVNNAVGIAALFAALVVSIVLHEGGHLFAAILMDFEVLGICLGPIRATRSHGQWKIAYSGKLFTGSISAVPRNTNGWRERGIAVVAGGPLMTLVTGLVAGVVLFHSPWGGWTKTFLAALVEFSGFLFVLGLIPNARTAKVRNDARLFWIFWKDGQEAQEVFLYHLMTMQEIAALRPRDYSAGLIHAMACIQGRRESMLVFAHTIALWALDRGDIETAKAWDERALELSTAATEVAQQATLARSACVDVLFRDDFASARRKLARIEIEALAPAWFRHRTKAIYSLIESDIPEALAEISRARYSFPKHLPYYEFEEMLLSQLHRKALAVEPKDLATCRTSHAI